MNDRSDETKRLERLSQRAAAHLLSLRPRTLRDGGPPRNPDGTYNGPQLVEWACRRRAIAVLKAAGAYPHAIEALTDGGRCSIE